MVHTVSSLFGVIYVGRMLEAVFLKPATPSAPRAAEAPFGVLVPLWILAVASIWFGLDAQLPESLANAGALALLGGRP